MKVGDDRRGLWNWEAEEEATAIAIANSFCRHGQLWH